MCAVLLLVILKTSNQQKLFDYVTAFFSRGFIVKKCEERESFLNFFNGVLLCFSSIVYGVFFMLLAEAFFSIALSFFVFTVALSWVFFYIILFQLLDISLSKLFDIRDEIGYLLSAKVAYLHNISLLLLPVLIIVVYNDLSLFVLFGVFLVLFLLSLLLLFVNNKNLIINKLFYFILYLCTLEIAPLLILYKVMV